MPRELKYIWCPECHLVHDNDLTSPEMEGSMAAELHKHYVGLLKLSEQMPPRLSYWWEQGLEDLFTPTVLHMAGMSRDTGKYYEEYLINQQTELLAGRDG